MTRKSHRLISAKGLRLIAIIAAITLAVVAFAAGRHWLSIESLRTHRDALLQFVAGRYWESLFLVAGVSVALVAVNAPAAAALMLLSGMVFGRWVGGALMAVSTSLGATVALLIVRYLAQDFVRARVRRHPRARQMVTAFGRNQGSYLLFLRMAPGFPFWLTNVLFGLTDVHALRFLFLTLIGIVPDALIYCNLGANLARVKSAHDLLLPGSIAALALLAVLCLSPVVIQQLQRRHVLRPGWPFGSGH
jgi:uncharacterized membrane protein YdjX (TVP38/TMEM64 family)